MVQGGSVLATGGLEVGAGGFTVDTNGKVVTGEFEAGYNTALLAPNLYVDDANNTTMVNGTLVVTTNAAANDVFEVHTTAGGGTSFRVDINGNVEAVGNIIATGVGKRVEADEFKVDTTIKVSGPTANANPAFTSTRLHRARWDLDSLGTRYL